MTLPACCSLRQDSSQDGFLPGIGCSMVTLLCCVSNPRAVLAGVTWLTSSHPGGKVARALGWGIGGRELGLSSPSTCILPPLILSASPVYIIPVVVIVVVSGGLPRAC